MSKNLIIGNWKMNPVSLKEAEKLASLIAKNISKIKKTEVVICPPFVYLEKLKKISLGRSRTGEAKKVILGAQDAFPGDVGAFTGEVSTEMLYGLGARYVIVGHSERRTLGETNTDINKKLKSALSASLFPVLCVGESNRDDNHEYFNFVKTQIIECLNGVNKNLFSKIIIAYEPVWAISTTVNRRDATALDSSEMVIYIRKVLADLSSPDIANSVRILYGGSVTTKDAEDFMANGGVDGLLVGRASLDAKKFVEIIKIAEDIK